MYYKYNSIASKWTKYIIVRYEQINEPESKELVIKETRKNTEQDEQEEEIDNPFKWTQLQPKKHVYMSSNYTRLDYPVTIIDHENASIRN